ncbi:MAG: NAD(P)H-quinone oxidoreductase subunit 3 [bacterium]|nr:NAD(P)H-quinone oxidoreductase subunit 3 [bacterium]
MGEYAGLGLFMLLGAGLVFLFLFLTSVLGPKLRFASKMEPFECGESQIVSPYQRFSIKFYMVAVSFIIFDVEVVFLYPWSVVFRDLGWYGFGIMLPFLAILAIGLAYEWLKGGLDWD